MNEINTNLPIRRRVRFREEDDIALLREVAGQNPFQNPETWQIIQEHLVLLTTKTFSVKTLKDHLDLLIKLWLEKTKIMTYTSGTEEDHTEKENLCQNIYGMMSHYRNNPKKKRKSEQSSIAGKISREMFAQKKFISDTSNVDIDILDGTQSEDILFEDIGANVLVDHNYMVMTSNMANEAQNDPGQPSMSTNTLEDMNTSMVSIHKEKEMNTSFCTPKSIKKSKPVQQPVKILGPVRSRKRKINVQRQGLSYLEQYDKTQLELRREQHKIEERKLALEERKLELEDRKVTLAENKLRLEEYEKKKTMEILEQRLAADLENRKDMNNVIQRQEKIIEMLISHFQK